MRRVGEVGIHRPFSPGTNQMGLCNREPSLSTHNDVIVLAWLTRLTKTLITAAGPFELACTAVSVMSFILIPLINLGLEHSDGLSRADAERLNWRQGLCRKYKKLCYFSPLSQYLINICITETIFFKSILHSG